MSELEILDSVNRNIYARADVVEPLAKLNGLFLAEKVLLDRLLPKIANSRILDIGIGGGRTIEHLLAISPDYVGVDYVSEFVELARRKFPHAKFLLSDARQLSEFGDGEFDFVLFSFNGIDYISHADRLLALRQIRRVLKTGGTFMFSTHNRDQPDFKQAPWQAKFELSAAYLKNLANYLRAYRQRRRMKQHEISTTEYAVVNDCAYRFSLLTYYIGVTEQIEQLRAVGFGEVQAFNERGAQVERDDQSLWVYYLAEK